MQFFTYFAENSENILIRLYQHFYLFFISTVIACIIGIALSIFVTREGKERIGKVVLNITAMSQAVPSIAVVALVFLVVGIGAVPALIALFVYSLVPIVFNSVSGLLSVEEKMIDAARGMGLTDRQILWKIKVPVVIPVIFAGIRSAATINIGTATVAAIIGGGGLGDYIFMGIKLNKDHLILIGAVLTALMAIIVDTILSLVEKKITPTGLQVNRN
jgi:osmoprotectant transport system permease protein